VAVVVAIDAGTSGVRSLAVDDHGQVVAASYRELTQHFPAPGLVEHDAAEIWALVETTLAELQAELTDRQQTTAAIGITNQRETAIAWDRSTGRPRHRAIVWQDRRTAARCLELVDAGRLPLVRARTGLVLDPYFSATKWAWMLEQGGVEPDRSLALGTVDDWVCWNLTGGAGAVGSATHATDASNASRTLCYDIERRAWSPELCDLFGVPLVALGEVLPSAFRYGQVAATVAGGAFNGVPVSGIAGDQQAALFGHGCHQPGDTKVTYGTGSFVLMNLGSRLTPPAEGLLTTVAWDLGAHAARDAADGFVYALEGAVFSSGATIQWLRDGLGLIDRAAEAGPLAAEIGGNDGVFLVPAFTGLGSPWWDAEARGAVIGITKGTGRAHFARAAVEAIAYQCRDVLEAMSGAAGRPVSQLRADGGAAAMDLLLQLQADQCDVPVLRPRTTEVTALGAAMLAGLAEGVWGSLSELQAVTASAEVFGPAPRRGRADTDYAAWRGALERSRHWERGAGTSTTA
jgi:glycerol kinase